MLGVYLALRMRFPAFTLLALLLAACGAPPRGPSTVESPPRARPGEPRVPAPRPDPASPAVRGKSYPECDPRASDADRGRVGLGMLVSDCGDDAGRNAVYVTRLVTVRGLPSPAKRAGLQVGDRVVRVDACEVESTHDLAMQLRTALPGWIARVYVERGGKTVDIFVPTVSLAGKGAAPTESLSTTGCAAINRKPAK